MKGPALPVEKKNVEKKNFEFFFSLYNPRPPLSLHKKFQPNRSSRLVGYREHIYDCLVLLYECSKNFFFFKLKEKRIGFLFSLYHPPATHECPQKVSAQSVQPFGRLKGTYVYTNVMFYYIDEQLKNTCSYCNLLSVTT